MALRPGHRVAEYRDDYSPGTGYWPIWRPAGSWMGGERRDWPQHRWRVLDEDDYCEESENGQNQAR